MENFIFLGGAPRSGTTLLVRLFDWHPEILTFPIEVPVLQKYWACPESDRETYFRERFFERGQGKHVQFVDPELLEAERRRLFKEFGNEIVFDVNMSAFLTHYQETLKQDRPLLGRVFSGLGAGLRNCNPEAKQRYAAVKYLLFKYPYYVELYAQDIAGLLPNSKFVHIIRSPLARYASAKKMVVNRGRLRKMSGLDFATALCAVWISSTRLAQNNLHALGNDRYRIVYYEKLLANPEYEMRCLAEWLGVNFTDSLLCPTNLGNPITSSSSFNGGGNNLQVDISFSNRQGEFHKNTSFSERSLIYYLMGAAHDLLGDYNIPKVKPAMMPFLWMLPFRFEPTRGYVRRALASSLNPTTMSRDELRAMLFHRLPTLAREGRAGFQ